MHSKRDDKVLKDITLGQYFPGESFIHRLDPRSKIIFVLLYIIIIFSIKNIAAYLIVALFIFMCSRVSKIPFKFMISGLKSIMFFIVLTAAFNLFLTPGKILFSLGFVKITYEGVNLAAFLVLRLLFLILGTSLLTLTTSPISLTDGIERLMSPLKKIGVPSHEIAMMMTIALRFIPTLLEETDKIIKAQTARGADFESGNILKRAKAMVPILIPLFMSAFRRADELSVAMECRCYRGGDGRTKLKVLKYKKIDLFGAVLIVFFGIIVLSLNFVKL